MRKRHKRKRTETYLFRERDLGAGFDDDIEGSFALLLALRREGSASETADEIRSLHQGESSGLALGRGDDPERSVDVLARIRRLERRRVAKALVLSCQVR